MQIQELAVVSTIGVTGLDGKAKDSIAAAETNPTDHHRQFIPRSERFTG